MGTAVPGDDADLLRKLRLPPVKEEAKQKRSSREEHSKPPPLTATNSASSGSAGTGSPPDTPRGAKEKGSPLQTPRTERGALKPILRGRKHRQGGASAGRPSPRWCLHKHWVDLSPREGCSDSNESSPRKAPQNVQFKAAAPTYHALRQRPERIQNGSRNTELDGDIARGYIPAMINVKNRRSTGFVTDLDLSALAKTIGSVGKAAKNSIAGKSGKKLRAYSSRSARGARTNDEPQSTDECASNLHRLFVTERLGEADISQDLVDFFGTQFLDQDSRFPVWLRKRQDFQSVCPRFCETDENFMQIKNQIPEELLLRKAFKMSPLLSNLHHIMMSKLIKRCEFQDFPAHTTVVEQGDVADKIFVVLEGTLDVTHKPKTGDRTQSGVLNEGLIFGDVGYETQSKRLSSVTTRTPCRLALIDCSLYRDVVHLERERQVRQLVEWISDEVPWAKSLSKRKVTMLAHLVTPRKLRPGEYVYHEGDSAESIYIVKSGVCQAVKIFAYQQEHRWPTASKDWDSQMVRYNREAFLREYREGDVFGEEPFAEESCRLWGVKAVDIGPLEAEIGSRSQEVEVLQIDAAACMRQKDGSAVLPQRMCNSIKDQWRKNSAEEVLRTAEEQDCVMIRDMVKAQAILQESPQRYLDRRHMSHESSGSFEAATNLSPVRVGAAAACLV